MSVPITAQAAQAAQGDAFPDYRRTVGLKYVKRGLQAVFAAAPPLVALPLVVFGGLELLNLWNQGELHRLFAVAQRTELTFDL
ncbi:hypothetical protein FOA52_008517, partial [Chlamydomonas sp. UWO 241]